MIYGSAKNQTQRTHIQLLSHLCSIKPNNDQYTKFDIFDFKLQLSFLNVYGSAYLLPTMEKWYIDDYFSSSFFVIVVLVVVFYFFFVIYYVRKEHI